MTNLPAFIVIDACDIGSHGKEHQRFDKQWEKQNCFVSKTYCSERDFEFLTAYYIVVDFELSSIGKRCEVMGGMSF